MEDFRKRKFNSMALDKHGREVFLADTSYAVLPGRNFRTSFAASIFQNAPIVYNNPDNKNHNKILLSDYLF